MNACCLTQAASNHCHYAEPLYFAQYLKHCVHLQITTRYRLQNKPVVRLVLVNFVPELSDLLPQAVAAPPYCLLSYITLMGYGCMLKIRQQCKPNLFCYQGNTSSIKQLPVTQYSLLNDSVFKTGAYSLAEQTIFPNAGKINTLNTNYLHKFISIPCKKEFG